MSLFVLSSKDGWVEIMYNGIDAVDVGKQVSKAKIHTLAVNVEVQSAASPACRGREGGGGSSVLR